MSQIDKNTSYQDAVIEFAKAVSALVLVVVSAIFVLIAMRGASDLPLKILFLATPLFVFVLNCFTLVSTVNKPKLRLIYVFPVVGILTSALLLSFLPFLLITVCALITIIVSNEFGHQLVDQAKHSENDHSGTTVFRFVKLSLIGGAFALGVLIMRVLN
ncbi:MAG: hypothetical protein ACO3MB_09940 [Saprospiraceae bacterium]